MVLKSEPDAGIYPPSLEKVHEYQVDIVIKHPSLAGGVQSTADRLK